MHDVHTHFPLETSTSCFYLPFTYSEDRVLLTADDISHQHRALKWCNDGLKAAPYPKEVPWM
jgi:hypothetical protein